MKRQYLFLSIFLLMGLFQITFAQKKDFVSVKDQNLYVNNKPFLIKGTNLGNWLNPEGYMFFFEKASSYRLINQAFCEMIGPDSTKNFWKNFKNNYITKEDIFFIKNSGANTIRIPFHYKLFTNEEYMGEADANQGFKILDQVISYCKEANLYVILDMHDAPGGQTGDNIDDSYGYPWLLVNENNQKQFIDIWTKIAKHYSNEKIILGYDLLNEPIATFFEKDYKTLNPLLEKLYKNCTLNIRKYDANHIIIFSGAQWNQNFEVFNDFNFDKNIMYQCHMYGCLPEQECIQKFIDFRTRSNFPMYMGETGENTDEWCEKMRTLLEKNNIGWTFWPYKKLVKQAGMMMVPSPKNWNMIVDYTQKDRSDFSKIREARPDQELVKNALEELLENIKYKNCIKNEGYIKALGLKP